MLDEYGSDPDRMKDSVINKYTPHIRKAIVDEILKDCCKINMQMKNVLKKRVCYNIAQELRSVARKQFIEEACEYLTNHRDNVETEDNGIAGWIPDYFIEDFRKVLEGG